MNSRFPVFNLWGSVSIVQEKHLSLRQKRRTGMLLLCALCFYWKYSSLLCLHKSLGGALRYCCLFIERGCERDSQGNFSWRIGACVGSGGGVSWFLPHPRDAIAVFQAARLEKTWNRFYRKIYAASEDKRAHAPNYCSPVSLLKSDSVSWVTSINYCAIVFPFFNELIASFVCWMRNQCNQASKSRYSV